MWKPQSHQRTLDSAIEKVQHMEERRSIKYREERSPAYRERRQYSPEPEYDIRLDPKTCTKRQVATNFYTLKRWIKN